MRQAQLLLLLCAACAAVPESRPAVAPRHVVLILADDMGAECVSSYGGTSIATPHLDALAAAGVRFTNAHSQPLCTPSRVKLLTGKSNARNYRAFSLLDPRERTLAHAFGDAGRATAVTGKWQLYGAQHYEEHAGGGARPEHAGFDTWCLWQVEQLGSRYWGPLVERDGEVAREDEDVYGPDLYLEHLFAFLDGRADEQTFTFWSCALPHDPFVRTPLSAPGASKGKDERYREMVAYLDVLVGRLVAGLEERGLRDDTLIVFVGDNGSPTSVRNERDGALVHGAKSKTIDAGTHVPLIASWPAGSGSGLVCADLVDLADVHVTLLDACGLPADDLDGVSFLPQMRGERGAPREWLYCYYNPRPGSARFPEQRWVRDVRWKLYADGRLFDVLADPLEATPLAADVEREVRTRLAAVLARQPARPAALWER